MARTARASIEMIEEKIDSLEQISLIAPNWGKLP